MPLTPEEQNEMEQLELMELEAEEAALSAAPQARGKQVYNAPVGPPIQKSAKDWIIGDRRTEMEAPSGTEPRPVAGMPPLAVPAAAVPQKLLSLAEFLNANAATRTGVSGVQGAIADPEHPLEGAGRGLVMGAGGEVLSALGSKIADRAMQKAVGRTKYTPGVGETLAEEGVWGTKGMMKGQVAEGMKARGQEIGELASEIPAGMVDPVPVAKRVEGTVKNIWADGSPSAIDVPKIEKIGDMAADIAMRGKEAGPQALQRRIAAGTRSYAGKEDPLQTLLGQASKAEQAGYSEALKDAYGHVNPGNPDALAIADNAYGALARASKGLNKEESLPASLLGLAAKFSAGAGVGYLAGGKEGAAVGALASTPLGMSTIGQAAAKAKLLNHPSIRQILLEQSKDEKEK